MSKTIQSAGISRTEGTIAVKQKNDTEFVLTFDQPKLRYTYALYVSKQELVSFALNILEMAKQEDIQEDPNV